MLFLSFLSPMADRFISNSRLSLRWWSHSLSFERKHRSSKQWPKPPRSRSLLEVVSIYLASFRCKLHCACRITHAQQRFCQALWMYFQPIQRARRASRLDHNRRALVHDFEQFDYVCVTHPHTAKARSRTDFVFVSRPMNVDETVARIRILLLQSVQP